MVKRRGTGGSQPRGHRRVHQREATAKRDWTGGLPMDALLAIFWRLDHIDILMAADRLCRSWRRAARDEPSVWRRIIMRGHEGISSKLSRMALEAVRRSDGQCEAFYGEYAGDDRLLFYLSEQDRSLKSLRLICCDKVTDDALIDALKEFPLLEELEISLCDRVDDITFCDAIGSVCPQLKHLRMRKPRFDITDHNYDYDAEGIADLQMLNSLQLLGNTITNSGLEIILDNCLNLETLDIRHCFNINTKEMNETLRAKCSRVKSIRLPEDPTDDCDFQFGSPLRSWNCCSECDSDNSRSDCGDSTSVANNGEPLW